MVGRYVSMDPTFEKILWLLPVIGLLLIYVLAAALRGAARRMTLTIGPFLLGWTMMTAGLLLAANHDPGNFLAAFARMALYGLGYLSITVHYVVLLVGATGMWLRRNEELRNPPQDAEQDQMLTPLQDVSNMTPEQLGQAMIARFKR